MEGNSNIQFGWKGIRDAYSWKEFVRDAWFPIILSSSICGYIFYKDLDFWTALKFMVDFSIPTLPCLLGLMVAAYVLVITVFYNQELRAKINPQYKRELMTTLNRTFAIALMVPAVSLVLTCFVGLIMSFEIPCEYADFINGSVFWLLLTMVTYSLLIIYGIAIDLFNIAQCSVKLD